MDGSQQPSYPVNMSDHDLLIRLDQKMNQMSLDVKDMRDGLSGRVAVLEAKVIGYDQVLVEYPPQKNVEQLNSNTKWIADFKLTWRILLSLSIAISSIVTFVLMAVGQALHLMGAFGH